MDPGTALATVTTTIQLISEAARYIKTAKGHDKDRLQLRAEAFALSVLLTDLKDDLSTLKPGESFAVKYGRNLQEPLHRLKEQLEELVAKLNLEPQSRTAHALSVLKWPISSKEAAEILDNIERVKSQILLSLVRDGNTTSREVLTTLQHVDGTLAKLEQDSVSLYQGELLSWLSPINFKIRQKSLESHRDANTLAWVVPNPTVGKWLSAGGHLSVIAPGGTGKTVLLSYLVQYLIGIEPRKGHVLYIYCNHNEQRIQTLDNLLGSLVRQLLSSSEKARHMATELRKRHDYDDSKPTIESLIEILNATVLDEQPVYLLIDALDELSDQDQRRQKLIGIVANLPINLLVTTRPIDKLQLILDPCEKFYFAAEEEDLKSYVTRSLQTLNQNSSVRNAKSSSVMEIANEIVRKSNGLFQAAVLCLASLADCVTLSQIRDVVRRLPEGLFPMYTETIDRIRSQGPRHAELAMKALMWVSFARRELAVEELQSAISVEASMVSLYEEDLPAEEVILSSCCGLLTVSENQRSVGFCHYTAQEYFVKHRDQLWSSANEAMASTCITYLSFVVFLRSPVEDFDDAETRKWDNPFLEYSAFHWGYHARNASETPLQEEIYQFLSNKALLENASQYGPCFLLSGYPRQADWFVPHAVHLASYFGLDLTVRRLIKENTASEYARGPGSVLPWHLAVEQEEVPILRILTKDQSESVLHDMLRHAAQQQKCKATEALVDLLNSKRALLSIQLKQILTISCRVGDYTTAQMLLSKIGEVKKSPTSYKTINAAKDLEKQEEDFGPLQIASRLGFRNIVELLLEFGKIFGYDNLVNRQSPVDLLNINTCSRLGTTSLYEASRHGHFEVARILLYAGASPLIANGENKLSCLHGAAIGAHEDLILLLLPQVSLRAEDGKFRTPLELLIRARSANWAESNARTRCLRHLLEHEDQLAGERGLGYLWLAAGSGDLEAPRWLEILIEGGVPANRQAPALAWSALHQAARQHRLENMRMLIRYGCDPNAGDLEGRKPLHHALSRHRKYGSCADGGLQILSILLENGAEINFPVGQWNLVPLEMAIMASRAAMVKFLLQKGADPSMCSIPPLCLAATNKTTSCLEALLEHGAAEIAEDRWGNSPRVISYLAAHDEWTQLFKRRNRAKCTPCHWAIVCSDLPLLVFLLGRMPEPERLLELSQFNYAAIKVSLEKMSHCQFWSEMASTGRSNILSRPSVRRQSAAAMLVKLLSEDFAAFELRHNISCFFASPAHTRANTQVSDFAYGVSMRSSNLEGIDSRSVNYAFADVVSIASGASSAGSNEGREYLSPQQEEMARRRRHGRTSEPGRGLESDLDPGLESGREPRQRESGLEFILDDNEAWDHLHEEEHF